MAAPDNTPPPRPKSVPADARWDHAQTGFEWSTGGVDADGRRHGRYRSWTRGGVLHGECDYEHGVVHGKNITYHPDETVASEAEWVRGTIMDSVFHRCAGPTPEPFAQAVPSVWSVRYCTRDGKTNYTIRYFAKGGTECGPDGKPLPARPASVSPDARWFADIERWVEGAIERGTNAQVGRWRWWSASGVLRHEEQRDGKGEATLAVHYTADGVLEQRVARDDAGETRDYYFDDGAISTRYKTDARGREIYRASWLPDGTLDDEHVLGYEGDELASVIERGAGGALVFDARRREAALSCVLFAPGGALPAASGEMSAGKLSGTWKIFDDAGKLRREVDTTPLAIEHPPTAEGLAYRLGEALLAVDAKTMAMPKELAGIDAAPWPDELPKRIAALVSRDPLVRDVAHASLEIALEDPQLAARALPYLARMLAHADVESSGSAGARSVAVESSGSAGARSVAQQRGESIESSGSAGARSVAIESSGSAGARSVAQQRGAWIDRPRLLAAIYEICARAHNNGEVAAALGAAWPAIFSAFGPASYAERHQILAIAKLAPVAKPDLLALARHDPDPATRAFALDRLTELPSFAADDAQPSLGDRDNLVRAAAAIAVGQRQGAAATRDVVRVLDESLRTWRDLARRFDELPYVDAHVLVAIAEAAAAIGTPDARSLARELCVHVDELDPRGALAYGNALLALAFGAGTRPFAKRFVEILDTLGRSKQFWIHEHDAAAVLAARGLPASRLALIALVGELRTAHDPEGLVIAKRS
jgi:hypothetical protein